MMIKSIVNLNDYWSFKKFFTYYKKIKFKEEAVTLLNLDIYKKIYQVLKYDGLINVDFSFIKWVILKKQFQGIYLSKENKIIHFTQLVDNLNKVRSRNTFLLQNFITTYKYKIFLNKENIKIYISVNPFDLNKKIKFPDYVKNSMIESIKLGV